MQLSKTINKVAEILARQPDQSLSYSALYGTLKEENPLDDGPWTMAMIMDAVEAGFVRIDNNNDCTLIVPLLKAGDSKAA